MMNNTKRYVIFSRRWWKDNPDWPTGREPHLGRKKFIARAQYEDDARTICKEWTERFKAPTSIRKVFFQGRVYPDRKAERDSNARTSREEQLVRNSRKSRQAFALGIVNALINILIIIYLILTK